MAQYHRRERRGDPDETSQHDLLWVIQADGTGKPKFRRDPKTLEDEVRRSPASNKHLDDGVLKIDVDHSTKAIELDAFDSGRAVRLATGRIKLNDPDLVIE